MPRNACNGMRTHVHQHQTVWVSLVLALVHVRALAATAADPAAPDRGNEGRMQTATVIPADAVRVQMDAPILIDQADPGEKRWGPYRMPKVFHLPGGELAATFAVGLDVVHEQGKPSPWFTSADDGKTWRCAEAPHPLMRGYPLIFPVFDGQHYCLPPGNGFEIKDSDIPAAAVEMKDGCGSVYKLSPLEDCPAEVVKWMKNVRAVRWTPQTKAWTEEVVDWDHRHQMVWFVKEGGKWYTQNVYMEVPPIRVDKELVHADYWTMYAGADGKARKAWPISLMASADNGRSWQRRCNILDEKFVDGFSEPAVALNGKGELVCVIRRDPLAPMLITHSGDRGRTWSAPQTLFDRGVFPNLLQLKNGVLVLSFGRPGVWLSFSLDGGRSWTKPQARHRGRLRRFDEAHLRVYLHGGRRRRHVLARLRRLPASQRPGTARQGHPGAEDHRPAGKGGSMINGSSFRGPVMKPQETLVMLVLAFLGGTVAAADAAQPTAPAAAKETKVKPAETWPQGKTYALKGLSVALSAPVQVASRKNLRLPDTSRDLTGKFLWYPQVARLADGELVAIIRLGGDTWEADVNCPLGFSWSGDGGLTWSELQVASKHDGYGNLILPTGDFLLLPFILHHGANGLVGPCNIIPKGKREVNYLDKAVQVTGFSREVVPNTEFDPAADVARLDVAGFYFDGRAIRLKDGKTWLTTIYGNYKGEKKCTLHAVESADGYKWKIRSTIAAGTDNLGTTPSGSNSEAEICRLPDGRLMCIFRLENEPYGQSWSRDEGVTWTPPTPMPPARARWNPGWP